MSNIENIEDQIEQAQNENKPELILEIPKTESFQTFIQLCNKGLTPVVEESGDQVLMRIELKTKVIQFEKRKESKVKKIVDNVIEVNFAFANGRG